MLLRLAVFLVMRNITVRRENDHRVGTSGSWADPVESFKGHF